MKDNIGNIEGHSHNFQKFPPSSKARKAPLYFSHLVLSLSFYQPAWREMRKRMTLRVYGG